MVVDDRVGRRRGVAIGIRLSLLGIALALAGNFGCGHDSEFDAPETPFIYTADDGATYFRSTQELKPPLSPEGKPAVRAHIGRSAGNGKVQVIWMERPVEGKMPIEAKTPGMKDWKPFPNDSAKLTWVSSLKAPDGKLFTYLN